MAQQVHGVVARAKGDPVEVVTIEVLAPGPGEVHCREGAINDEFPFLLALDAPGVALALRSACATRSRPGAMG